MTTFTATNPAYADVVRSGLLSYPIARFLDISFGRIEPGRVEVFLPYREQLSVGAGIFQAGIVGLLADVAAGAAAGTLLPPGYGMMTADYTVKLLAPAQGERLVARGEVVRPGRTLIVSRADVFAVRQGDERLCATALATIMTMQERKE